MYLGRIASPPIISAFVSRKALSYNNLELDISGYHGLPQRSDVILPP
jgi:hypothetical protein